MFLNVFFINISFGVVVKLVFSFNHDDILESRKNILRFCG